MGIEVNKPKEVKALQTCLESTEEEVKADQVPFLTQQVDKHKRLVLLMSDWVRRLKAYTQQQRYQLALGADEFPALMTEYKKENEIIYATEQFKKQMSAYVTQMKNKYSKACLAWLKDKANEERF